MLETSPRLVVSKKDLVKVVYRKPSETGEKRIERMKVVAVEDKIYVSHGNHFHAFDLQGEATHMYIDEVKKPTFWQRLFS